MGVKWLCLLVGFFCFFHVALLCKGPRSTHNLHKDRTNKYYCLGVPNPGLQSGAGPWPWPDWAADTDLQVSPTRTPHAQPLCTCTNECPAPSFMCTCVHGTQAPLRTCASVPVCPCERTPPFMHVLGVPCPPAHRTRSPSPTGPRCQKGWGPLLLSRFSD